MSGNSITNVGDITVTATGLSNSNYALPSAKTATISITPKTVGLTWGTTTWTYNRSEHSTTCTATGVISGDTCTVILDGNSITNVGSVTATATGLSNRNYQLPSTDLTRGLVVMPLTATLSWGSPRTWEYDGQAHSTTCTVSNVIQGDSCTVTLSGNSITNYGSSTVTATALSNSNYALPSSKTTTISITKRAVTITADDTSKAYGAPNPTFTASITSGSLVAGGDLGTISATCSATTSSPVGTYAIVPSYTANNNYTVTSVNGTLTISAQIAILELSKTGETKYTTQTIDISTYVTQHTGTVSYSIKTNGTTTASTLNGSTLSCGAMSLSNDNNQSVVINVTDAGDANHSSVTKTFTVTVQKFGVTITWNNNTTSIIYGNTLNVGATASASGGTLGTLTYTTTENYTSLSGTTLTGTSYSASNSDTITCTHNRTTTVKQSSITRSVSVTQVTLQLSWGTTSWIYDGQAHSTTVTFLNKWPSDTVTPTFSNNSITHVGSQTVTITAVSNNNYKLPSSGTSTTISITQATIANGGLTLSWNSYTTTMRIGEEQTISATSNFGTILYVQSDPSVVTFIAPTTIKALKSGTSAITATVQTNSYQDWESASISFVVTVKGGVKIYYNGNWVDATPYIYDSGSWKEAAAYVYDNNAWKPC